MRACVCACARANVCVCLPVRIHHSAADIIGMASTLELNPSVSLSLCAPPPTPPPLLSATRREQRYPAAH